MTEKEFIKHLQERDISFTIKKDIIIINGGDVNLDSCTSLPENVQFNNGGDVDLRSCTSLPENVQFNNGGDVYLRSCKSIPENVQFNNGGDVDLRSLTSLPENVQFNNGGRVYIKDKTISKSIPYLERYKIPIVDDHVILYKKVSKDYKTQEGTANETTWALRTTLEHSNWNPSLKECGPGKFHACAKPRWCDMFRNEKDDKYIAVRIHVQDLYEWTNNPSYPQKIGFRRGYVVGEVERNIDKQ